jgi:hypothetical protein
MAKKAQVTTKLLQKHQRNNAAGTTYYEGEYIDNAVLVSEARLMGTLSGVDKNVTDLELYSDIGHITKNLGYSILPDGTFDEFGVPGSEENYNTLSRLFPERFVKVYDEVETNEILPSTFVGLRNFKLNDMSTVELAVQYLQTQNVMSVVDTTIEEIIDAN